MRAFTTIELLISVVIIVILSTMSFLTLSGSRVRRDVETSVNELVAVVRDTQNRSITQEDGQQWGIRFNNTSTDKYEVFKGTSYASGTVKSVYSFRRGVGFGEPPAGFSADVIFNAITGKPTAAKVISLIGSSGQKYLGDLTVNLSGVVTGRVENGLVGYWHFDEGTGTSTADSSGSANTGTLTNGPTWQSGSNCKAGGCLSFDGTNDYVDAGNGSALAVTSGLTVNAWVKTGAAVEKIFLDNKAGGYNGYTLQQGSANPAKAAFSVASATQDGSVQSLTTINDNKWHLVTGTFNSGAIKIYIDGQLDNTGSLSFSSLSVPTRNTIIGASATITAPFSGTLDEVRIYNRALSADDIKAIYEATK